MSRNYVLLTDDTNASAPQGSIPLAGPMRLSAYIIMKKMGKVNRLFRINEKTILYTENGMASFPIGKLMQRGGGRSRLRQSRDWERERKGVNRQIAKADT